MNLYDRIISKLLLGSPIYFGGRRDRVSIHATAVVNNALFNAVSGDIEVREFVFFGHNVCVLTGTHDIHKRRKERQREVPKKGRDIVIGEGAWVASNATIIGPVIIGADSVVCAGAVVVDDVPKNTVVGGVPARVIKSIEFNKY